MCKFKLIVFVSEALKNQFCRFFIVLFTDLQKLKCLERNRSIVLWIFGMTFNFK